MEKAVITQIQAERIREWEHRETLLLRFHVKKILSKRSKPLQDLTLDELARALYVGYEVEVEVKVGDWLVNNRNGLMFQIEDRQEDKDIARMNHIRHATESEIVEEKGRRMDSKIDGLLVGLSSGERVRLREKLECGDY